ncbi:MAG TPA: hypothetical protein VM925_03985 [Labilithrix sp.]|nr:hypothetical protein [Labilithrix sp.]
MFAWRSVFGLLAIVLAIAGCSSDASRDEEEESFDYGRDEMKGAIEGTWEGSAKPGAGSDAPSSVSLTLTYSASDVGTLCNNRVLSRDSVHGVIAPRCMDMSSMNVSGTLTSLHAATSNPAQNVAVRGSFSVMSLRFTGGGHLQAEFDGGTLGAELSSDVLTGSVARADGTTSFEFELRRKK